VAFLFMLSLAIIQMMPQTSQGLFSPEELPYLPLAAWLFLSATVSTVGMILPGISGSFIMLLMGGYFMTLKAISAMELTILIPVVAGVVVGGFFGVRIIRNLLKDHPQNLYFGILGLMVGSIFIIYPGIQINLQGLASLIGLTLCGGISYWFGRYNHS
jgi:putative membrane protein